MIVYCLAFTHNNHKIYNNFRYAYISTFRQHETPNYSYLEDIDYAVVISIYDGSYFLLEWDETIWNYAC